MKYLESGGVFCSVFKPEEGLGVVLGLCCLCCQQYFDLKSQTSVLTSCNTAYVNLLLDPCTAGFL